MFLKKLCSLVPLSVSKSSVRYSSASFKYTQFIRERKPDADLDVEDQIGGGEQIVFAPEPTWTGVEESRDPEEWAAVERVLPQGTVPEPPKHDSYPTPSGWFPATAKFGDHSYFVKRTRFHNHPIYEEIFDGGNRHMTVINKVQGDIWALESDLRKYLEEKTGARVYTQVDEVCCKVRVRGIVLSECSNFLKEKGF